MLNDTEITLVEGVYLAISYGELPDEVELQIQHYIYKHNFEQYVYLQWLINRWSFLKRDEHHMPLRTTKLNNYGESHNSIVKKQTL